MTIQMNISEAKARLSELLEAAASGDEVVIAKSGKAIARLVPIEAPEPRKLGFFPLDVPDRLFEPLSDDEADGWE